MLHFFQMGYGDGEHDMLKTAAKRTHVGLYSRTSYPDNLPLEDYLEQHTQQPYKQVWTWAKDTRMDVGEWTEAWDALRVMSKRPHFVVQAPPLPGMINMAKTEMRMSLVPPHIQPKVLTDDAKYYKHFAAFLLHI